MRMGFCGPINAEAVIVELQNGHQTSKLLPFPLTLLGHGAPLHPNNASGTRHPAKTIPPGETLEASRVEVPESIENRH